MVNNWASTGCPTFFTLKIPPLLYFSSKNPYGDWEEDTDDHPIYFLLLAGFNSPTLGNNKPDRHYVAMVIILSLKVSNFYIGWCIKTAKRQSKDTDMVSAASAKPAKQSRWRLSAFSSFLHPSVLISSEPSQSQILTRARKTNQFTSTPNSGPWAHLLSLLERQFWYPQIPDALGTFLLSKVTQLLMVKSGSCCICN